MKRSLLPLSLGLSLAGTALAQVPQTIHHQGRITVQGVNFDGGGRFKFMLYQGKSPNDLVLPLWKNDDSAPVNFTEPTSVVGSIVTTGLYSVALGSSPQSPITADLTPPLGSNVHTYLRIWFSDGSNGSQLLSPDRKLASVPFARHANISGQNISLLNNDAGYLTDITGLSISDLSNDSGFVTGTFIGSPNGASNVGLADLDDNFTATNLEGVLAELATSGGSGGPDLSVTGNTILGDAATDTLTVNAGIDSDLLPSTASTYGIGSVAKPFRSLALHSDFSNNAITIASHTGNGSDVLLNNVGGTFSINASNFSVSNSATVNGNLTLGTTGLFQANNLASTFFGDDMNVSANGDLKLRIDANNDATNDFFEVRANDATRFLRHYEDGFTEIQSDTPTGGLRVSNDDSDSASPILQLSDGTNDVFSVDRDGNLTLSGTINTAGGGGTSDVNALNLSSSGNTTLGDASDDGIAFNGSVSSSIVPDIDLTHDLGSSTHRWRNLYLHPEFPATEAIKIAPYTSTGGDISITNLGGACLINSINFNTSSNARIQGTLVTEGNTTVEGNVTIDGDFKYSTPVAKKLQIPSAAFSPDSHGHVGNQTLPYSRQNDGGLGVPASGSLSRSFMAPINLPDGATITALKIYGRDQNPDFDMNLFVDLYRRTPTAATEETMADDNLSLTGNSSTIQTFDITPLSNPVISEDYQYYLRVSIQTIGSGFNPGGDRFYGATVEYTIDQL